MEQSEVIEGNLVISAFMGYYFNGGKFYSRSPGRGNWFKEAKYHSSWDWLIPAIQNFKRMPTEPGAWSSHMEEIESCVTDEFEILPAWESLVNAIKWYNSQPVKP